MQIGDLNSEMWRYGGQYGHSTFTMGNVHTVHTYSGDSFCLQNTFMIPPEYVKYVNSNFVLLITPTRTKVIATAILTN